MLEKLTQDGSKDSFHWYALALEYANAERVDDAVRTFDALRAIDAGYVPMYLMCGTTLTKAGRKEEARTWLEAGVVAASAKGDTHALSEIQGALAAIG
jgi:hypothetical protein